MARRKPWILGREKAGGRSAKAAALNRRIAAKKPPPGQALERFDEIDAAVVGSSSWKTVLTVTLPPDMHAELTGVGLEVGAESSWAVLEAQVTLDNVVLREFTPREAKVWQGYYGPVECYRYVPTSPARRTLQVQVRRTGGAVAASMFIARWACRAACWRFAPG